ncbi:hypothetical protein NDU88_005034 [Pleurodeles waltl]|uniref:Uncharacterized protein n=1 Tax=Pleurodeles waltl TaxID=8319 RepID=A0AAV7LK16_PLEWA|nr:hypothetical protein NDU88_005034 [Pleurodeles waltl]
MESGCTRNLVCQQVSTSGSEDRQVGIRGALEGPQVSTNPTPSVALGLLSANRASGFQLNSMRDPGGDSGAAGEVREGVSDTPAVEQGRGPPIDHRCTGCRFLLGLGASGAVGLLASVISVKVSRSRVGGPRDSLCRRQRHLGVLSGWLGHLDSGRGHRVQSG